MRNIFKFLKKILLEMPAIMLGLLVALALNSWKENNDRAYRAANLLASINNEIKHNYEIVPSVKESTINIYKRNDSIISLYKNSEIKSLSIATITSEAIRNVAWKTASLSDDFSAIPIETLTELSKVYLEQERVEFIRNSIDNLFINSDPELSSLNLAKIKQNHMSRFISRYEDLIKEYEDYLKIDSNKNTNN
ncbi:hypothetical protein [Ichthyenterobacterium magnum]|uniref:Uncharacterized protein n=1 Tax=Ichthyenterobacterium magnum TaxID=1230530 RepID=A0A420DKR9_9FLAO|nr:hypothetical protein [Ichthyenterobacterium magnum]RKE94809.1 hypothetical protein BXY80_1822 [Ichthyenterobacterium magnum]